MGHLYTLGYARWSPAAVQSEIDRLGATLVDVRMAPTSRRPEWRRDALHALLGRRYVHMPALGNVNFRDGGPIRLHHPEQAVGPIARLLERGPVVLLCGCDDWQTCHRSVAADYLAQQIDGVQVRHLEPPAPVAAPGEMLALTLHQPWASLIAVAAVAPDLAVGKRIETRSWATQYRGPLAIHAAKGGLPQRALLALCEREPFRSTLSMLGITDSRDLPRGAVVATATLRDCVPTEQVQPGFVEAAFGDYAPGRFAWLLEDIRRVDPPIPARGAQQLWRWTMPQEQRDA